MLPRASAGGAGPPGARLPDVSTCSATISPQRRGGPRPPGAPRPLLHLVQRSRRATRPATRLHRVARVRRAAARAARAAQSCHRPRAFRSTAGQRRSRHARQDNGLKSEALALHALDPGDACLTGRLVSARPFGEITAGHRGRISRWLESDAIASRDQRRAGRRHERSAASPKAIAVTPGGFPGKSALRASWHAALENIGSLHFEVVRAREARGSASSVQPIARRSFCYRMLQWCNIRAHGRWPFPCRRRRAGLNWR
jgi:hypothetical protein